MEYEKLAGIYTSEIDAKRFKLNCEILKAKKENDINKLNLLLKEKKELINQVKEQINVALMINRNKQR